MGRRLARLLFLLGLSLAPCSSYGGREDKARELYFEGLSLYRKGDFEGALASFSDAISEHSGLTVAYAGRAQARQALGDREGSQADLKRALGVSAGRPEELVARGNARLLAGDLKRSLEDFEAAVKKDDQLADAYLGRGRVFRIRGDMAAAVKDWQAAVKHDPDLVIARFNLASALHDLGQDDVAVKELTRALNGNPKFALPYGLLGVVFASKGDLERALKAYSKAILLMPTYAYAHIGRGMVYVQQGNKPLAFKDFEMAAKYSPGDYAPYYNRGEVSFRMGDKKEALDDFRRVLKLPVPDPPAAMAVGNRFMESGMWEEAGAMFTKALEAVQTHPDPSMSPYSVEAYLARARSSEQLGRPPEALKDLDAAVALSSASARSWTSRGKLLHTMGRLDEAAKSLARALAAEPEFAPAWLAQGNLNADLRRYPEAVKDYESAVRHDPGLAEAYNNRGVLYAKAFRSYDQAVEDLNKAVSLDPENADYLLNLGAARLSRRDFWKAIGNLDKALSLKASKPLVLRQRAEARFRLGDSVSAFKDIEEAIKEAPRSSELYIALGHFRLMSQDYPRAIQDLGRAQSLDKRAVQAYLYRGLAYGALGEYRSAIREFEQAAKASDKPFEALTLLCQAHRLRGRPRDAVSACDKAIQQEREYWPAYIQRGLAFLALGSFERVVRDIDDGTRLGMPIAQAFLARSVAHTGLRQYRQSDEAYREAMALDYLAKSVDITFGEEPAAKWDYPFLMEGLAASLERDADDPYTHVVRGNALHNVGRYDHAILEYTRAMEVNDQLAPAFLARGQALAAQNSMDAAEHDIRRATELEPTDSFGHLSLSKLLASRTKYPEALTEAATALKLQGEHPRPDTFVQAGNLRYFLKEVKKAFDNYKLAIQADPFNADAYNGVGLCYFARRQYDKALEYFGRAIALRPREDRFQRNRASTYVNKGDFANAESAYRMALLVNRDPEAIKDYEGYIKNCQKMLAKKDPASSSGKPEATQ